MKKIFVAFLSLFILLAASAQEKPEGLFINSKAFDFKGKDQRDQDISLKELRKKGNVVVIFYRGYWCPYCNKELKRFQDSLVFIQNKGAQIVAITPEANDGVDSTVAKTGVSFPIISDLNMKIATAYKVAFKVDERTIGRYKNAGIDLLKTNKQITDAYLPVPAVYIVNVDGSVTYRFFDEDYRKRVWVKDLLNAL